MRKKYTQKVEALPFEGTFDSLQAIITSFEMTSRTMLYIDQNDASHLEGFRFNYYEDDNSVSGTYVADGNYVIQSANGDVSVMSAEKFHELFS